MRNSIFLLSKKDIFIIFLITVVFFAVILVFSLEFMNNKKINNSKKNFNIVKEELSKEVIKCKGKEQIWIFGISCEETPTINIISDYFNKIKKLKNPHDNLDGMAGSPGSVQITIVDSFFILSIDTDANGGIDFYHKIKFK